MTREARSEKPEAGGRGWLAAGAPAVAIELASTRATVVGLAKGPGGPVVEGWASEALPPGALVPSLTALNVVDVAAVTDAVKRAIARAGVKAKRVALVIPDLAAKVTLVPFETVPARSEDLEQLIGWQVRKSAPFPIEDARLSFIPGAPHGPAGRTFVVTMARRDVIRQYEDIVAAAGAHAGVVDLASFNAVNAVLAADRARPQPPGASPDWLFVGTAPESQSLAIVRGDALGFFRSRPVEGDERLSDLVHQTAMYYEDRLGGTGFARVVLAGGAAWSGDSVRQGLTERLGAPVTSIEPRHLVAFGGTGFDDLQPAAADALVAPLGILLREQEGA